MWDQLPIHAAVQNLLSWQRKAALDTLDREIAKDHKDGYGLDVDAALDRRLELMRQQWEGRV